MDKNKKFSIKEFFRNNYKLFIPIALMIVLFAAFFFYYRVSLSNAFRVDTEGSFYQYFYNKKYEYNGVVSKNKKGVIVDFVGDEDIVEDSTPVYYKDEDTVLFLSDMSVVMPTFNCSEYMASKYSYIEYIDNGYKLTTNNYSDNLGHYFLYDGDDLYFFIEDTILSVNGEEIELSAFSYVVCKYRDYISYYNKENDEYRTISIDNDEVSVSNDYYNVLVSRDIIDYYGTNVILTSDISVLNTIDQKG